MKYIKEYNQTYYYNIDSDEFLKLFYTEDGDISPRPFTQSEIDCLKKLCNNQFGFDVGHACISIIDETKSCHAFKIYDEWYLIRYYIAPNFEEYYYKCDQLEGLIMFLQKVFFKK